MRCRLRHLLFTLLLFSPWAFDSPAVAQKTVMTNNAVTLTNAAQIRALTTAEAARRFPVQLRGVAIQNQGDGQLAIMDDTAGLYAMASREAVAQLQRGDLVEVKGASNPGRFAPYVDVSVLQKMGVGKGMAMF